MIKLCTYIHTGAARAFLSQEQILSRAGKYSPSGLKIAPLIWGGGAKITCPRPLRPRLHRENNLFWTKAGEGKWLFPTAQEAYVGHFLKYGTRMPCPCFTCYILQNYRYRDGTAKTTLKSLSIWEFYFSCQGKSKSSFFFNWIHKRALLLG